MNGTNVTSSRAREKQKYNQIQLEEKQDLTVTLGAKAQGHQRTRRPFMRSAIQMSLDSYLLHLLFPTKRFDAKTRANRATTDATVTGPAGPAIQELLAHIVKTQVRVKTCSSTAFLAERKYGKRSALIQQLVCALGSAHICSQLKRHERYDSVVTLLIHRVPLPGDCGDSTA